MSKIEQALKKATEQRLSDEKIVSPNRSMKQSDRDNSQDLAKKHQAEQLLDALPVKVANDKIVALHKDKSIVAEEYDKLRSALLALTQGSEFLNTLLVTSCASEEGKSLTILNLAISLAREQDHTVLLVDTDLRRPSLHRYLGIKPEFGLVHCLRDGVPLEKALIKTGLGKLVVLPAGEALRDPLDLLSSNKMRNIVRELKERYSERYVLFDTPPAMPFSDASVLAGMTDASLIVVREGKASTEDVHKIIDSFKPHNLLGAVYNDANFFTKKQSYYYY